MKNIISLFVGIIISLVILEILLRIYNPYPSVVKGDKIILRANSRVIYNNEKYNKLSETISVSTNSIGFRGPNPLKDFGDYLTIITIGGSTTHCSYNSDDRTWSSYLSKDLSEKFKNVWLNNAGLNGHTTFGHIILMEDYIIKIKPKIVLFLVGINDLGRASEEGCNKFSLFNFDNTSIMTRVKVILYKSELVGLLVNISRKIKAVRKNLDYDINFDLKKLEHMVLNEDEIQERLRGRDGDFESYRERLLRLTEICKKNNIEPIFITQPVLYGRGIDKSTGVNLETIKISSNSNGLLGLRLLELCNQNTVKIAKEKGLFFIDLSNEMPKDYKYYFDLIHFTDEGNEVIAKIISKHLTAYLRKRYDEFIKD